MEMITRCVFVSDKILGIYKWASYGSNNRSDELFKVNGSIVMNLNIVSLEVTLFGNF